ncbi:MAG: hypothetical protein WCO79_02635 [bacterium]
MAAAKAKQQGQPETIQVVGSGTTADGKAYRVIKRPHEDSPLWGREVRAIGPRVLDRDGCLLVFEDEVGKLSSEPPPRRFAHPSMGLAFA